MYFVFTILLCKKLNSSFAYSITYYEYLAKIQKLMPIQYTCTIVVYYFFSNVVQSNTPSASSNLRLATRNLYRLRTVLTLPLSSLDMS